MSLHYPNFIGGKGSKMRTYFRKNKDYPVGHPKRYPISNFVFRYPVDISFGSVRPSDPTRLRINIPEGIKKSADKILTKNCIKDTCPVVTPYCRATDFLVQHDMNILGLERAIGYPMVAKKRRGMGGEGMYFIDNSDELLEFIQKEQDLKQYFFEKKYNFNKEYRIHVSPLLVDIPINYSFKFEQKQEDGSKIERMSAGVTRTNGEIHGIQKKKRNGVATLTRNFDRDSVIFSSSFNRPPVWEDMVKASVEAAKLMKLDFCCTDILYNSETREFVISETNTNPGMDSAPDSTVPNITAQHYQIAFPHIVLNKRAHLTNPQNRCAVT